MAEDQDKDSKTEAPTAKRLEDAIAKGQFAKSQDLQAVVLLIAALGALGLTLTKSVQTVVGMAVRTFSNLGAAEVTLRSAPTHLMEISNTAMPVLLPIMVTAVVAALLVGGFQSGFNLTPKVFEFDPNKFNPVKGFGRIFSKQAAVKGGLDILKVIAIALILAMAARTLVADPMFNAPIEAGYLAEFMHRSSMAFLARLIIAMSIIAALSYAYEKFKTGEDMKMSRQDIKDESKQQEGSPESKMAMRRMARRLMQRQMVEAVPTADVVITNPTHFAIALKYERGVDSAPIVLAKGENRFAQRLKAIAKENGVPMVENKPVARFLFKVGQVGQPIPSELFQAVANILAHVYRTHRYYFHELKSRRLLLAQHGADKK
ncbi:EscU/YscU/HrcU family type III secretion system export apparatus switch protein [Actomonas aquatica]|uniref:EscU/YscU/HrcU family type III secretion system export apparatus switch protein n=1 Tax=Actomonas aquatica TaxID=2866162 RepID=A0ABZ1CG48_9BACT|nr:EscU/YscU/HrcU family type III secretion system export apparatus switch protein [Opitutus sp. WL0086]WRQ89265.1 EscU/YscU/HrcU family type III secretion system export apparatus switch protein [Opitutus sp. WL0086]